MIKYHTEDKINQKSIIELSARNKSIHNLSHHTSYPAHHSAHTWLPVPVPILTVKRRWPPVFWGKKVHAGDPAGGFSDLEMTWLLYCAGAATHNTAAGIRSYLAVHFAC